MKLFFTCLIIFSTNFTRGQEIVPEVVVDSEDEAQLSNLSPYSTTKIENVSPDKLKQPQRQTIADVMRDQVGVDTQTYCANCGAKRLSINGLKAEHTSILVDGLPLHSAVSSFYGVDSIPVNGIQNIEVMRGTGASLTNPEAIGGTINLITVDPLQGKQNYNTSISVNDTVTGTAQNHSFLISLPSEDKKRGLTIGAQFTKQEAWDEDENHVAESPDRQNSSAILKYRVLPDDRTDIKLRLGYSDLTILGGHVDAKKPSQVRETPAQETDFEDGNVERKFTGNPEQITDWISLKRYEAAAHLTKYLDQETTLDWNTGFARQEQKAIYQHGFDYANNDNIFVSDLSMQKTLREGHLLKSGVFFRYQRLRSTSVELFQDRDPALPKDEFDNTSIAAYSNYTYIASESLEIDLALRLDHTSIDWLDLSNRIDETILAPRYQIRHDITEHLSQRFSYGLGYRAPLTFFESQHGNEENGYQVDITKLEKANSLVYSLSQNTPTYYATLGVHYTYLENMAYGQESQDNPIFYINSDENYEIWAQDLLLGYKVKPWWLLEASFEYFRYQDGYTRKLPTAAIEERMQLRSTVDYKNWTHYFNASLVGARNLSRYGRYTDHFVDRNQFPSPETRGDELKDQNSPAFVVIDTSFTYNLKKKYDISFGINNLLDETQVKYGDSPSTWHWHFDNAHYDGLHTWGPNRGREYFVQFSMNL